MVMPTWREQVADAIVGRQPGRTGYIYVNCPACGDRVDKPDRSRKCSVDAARGWIRCWRCDWRSRLPGDWSEDEVLEPDDVADGGWVDTPPDFEEPSDYGPLTAAAARYLRGRGVDPSVWATWQLGYARAGVHRGRVIMPVVVAGGAWVGWVGRWIGRKSPMRRPYHTSKGMNRGSYFMGDWQLEEGDGPVVVVEGPLDVLHHAHTPGMSVVGCMGKPTKTHLERVVGTRRPVVIVLDGDAWGEGLAHAQGLRLMGHQAYAVVLGPEEDPGVMPPDRLAYAVRMAVATRTDIDTR